MTHLSEIELSRWSEDALGDDERARCQTHLDECVECRAKLKVEGVPLGQTAQLQATPLPAEAYPERPQLARGALLGRYVVIDVLGAGGMGEVYTAYDPELDRRVALKLVRAAPGSSSSSPSQGQTRLLREAQAMARLSHPNVVAVYDVGVVDGQVFLAMELVEGTTLKHWSKTEHPWRKALKVFIEAGRGLAAAHQAGIVHRDFKPDNVLLGNDGRVRVLDFGLARAPVTKALAEVDTTPTPSHHLLLSPLTQDGNILGTPRYMAPEQFLGRAVDARSDQFSFCVALAEVMYGEAPFEGDDLVTRARAVTHGEIRPPPKSTRVPAWVRRVIVRGLKVNPEDRFHSMHELLEALEADPSIARRRMLIATAAVASIATAGVVGAKLSQEKPQCTNAAVKLQGVWDTARRTAVHDAFIKSNLPYAAASFERLAQVLDTWAHDWETGATEACAATYVRRDQSVEAFDLRMECLGQRLEEVRVFTSLLQTPERKLIEGAPRAASSLASVKACNELTQLRVRQPLPSDPQKVARITELRNQLARLNAMSAAWKYKDALEPAKQLATAAAEVGWRPLEAQANFRLGYIEDSLSNYDSAITHYEASLHAAVAGKDDRTVASSWIRLFAIRGTDQVKFELGHWMAAQALPYLERFPNDLELRGSYFNHLGSMQYTEGKYADAKASYAAAVEAYEKAQGPEGIDVSIALENLGVATSALGNNDEALAKFERVLAIQIKTLGPDTPASEGVHSNIAAALLGQSRYAEAHEHNLRALALAEEAQGPEGDDVALILGNLAYTYIAADQPQEALTASQRALKINSAKFGANHPNTGFSMLAYGSALQAAQQFREASEADEKALKIAKIANPDGSELTFYVASTIGELELAQFHGPAAEKAFREAIAIGEKVLGKDVPTVVRAYVGLGGALQAQQRHLDAIKAFEHARALVKPDQNPHEEVGRIALRTACSFAAEHHPETERQSLLAEALTEFKAAGAMGHDGLTDTTAVLDGKPCPLVAAAGVPKK